ncbi:hypothetical protein COS75_02460 [Candidatus Pacearchaeota archaeon CG06_land_8_20_14_3_00_35_12]|nr:MAG: hypothetical protein COS75_02460 [Candidatus Pacearchaeota archaeon CG06_land_8_20_14_3_00_35_12]
MKTFLHPHNIGEIKNADGVGKVGNPICLLPQEKIHKNSDNVEISKIKEKERVLTHTGNYEEIIKISSRGYKGDILMLKNNLGKINLTPEHLIYAMHMPKGDKYLRNYGKRKVIPSWYHAEDLKKGDIILYPILKKEKDIEFLNINIPKPKYDFKSNEIPNKVSLNSDLLKLFGYFLSEGNIQDKPCKTYISFTLNIEEKDIIEDIKQICKNLFGIDVKLKENSKVKTAQVFLYSTKIARWFKKLFGNGAEYKKIPDFIMSLPKEKQKSLIFGLWKGDGYINLKRNSPRAGYATISYQLAQQIKILLLRQKIVPSIYEDKARKIRGVKHKKAHRIYIGQRDSLTRLCDILGTIYSPKSHEAIKSWFDENYLYTPITNKEIIAYQGKVNNLEVNSSHSFVSEAFCLHNCGDVMWVYIKVAKNKKGHEIIKDIKFKTFGCVAAVATSSMITDLAKGKTLQEAMKVQSKDVSKALGKLPPIKEHCSHLAQDALRAAIKDYLKKKRK